MLGGFVGIIGDGGIGDGNIGDIGDVGGVSFQVAFMVLLVFVMLVSW